jgi:long-chain acyl-CoA synthetase
MIVRGGYRVNPREIEQVLAAHPAVAEVAVTALADPHLGQDAGAAVVPRPGTSPTPQELHAFARERLPATKHPGRIWLASTLPKGPGGKIAHRKLQPPPSTQTTAGSRSASPTAQPDPDQGS